MSKSFGARACRTMRQKILAQGISVLPRSWQRQWMIRRIVATPPWADMRAIRDVYQRATELTQSTGTLWTVGHIVPLNHPYVSGLHVHWNLTLEPARVNFSKGNRWLPDQLDLFEPEQPVIGQMVLF